jgi:hypothetical protein
LLTLEIKSASRSVNTTDSIVLPTWSRSWITARNIGAGREIGGNSQRMDASITESGEFSSLYRFDPLPKAEKEEE